MGLDERLGWLILGCAIGFILGYIVRSLQEIKSELDEVDAAMKKDLNEGGFIRNPLIMDVALLLVVILTVWASFASQSASNAVKSQQDRISRVTICTQTYLSRTIRALNERTTYAQQQISANVELQRAQTDFLRIVLISPPVSEARKHEALSRYFDALTAFVNVSGKVNRKADKYPYPTNQELQDCLEPK